MTEPEDGPSSSVHNDLEKANGVRIAASASLYHQAIVNKETLITDLALEDTSSPSASPSHTPGWVEDGSRRSDDPIIVTWSSQDDPADPMNWSFRLRWTLISLVSAVTFITGLSSSMFAPAVPALMDEFNSTNSTLASFVVTVFVLGLAAGPLVSAPCSELYGRLVVGHVGNVGFLIFTIACALASDLNMMIVFRLFQGIFGSVPLTNGGGLIADMIKQEERGFALAMFTLGVLLGPVVGPVSGAFLAASKGWRWVFWVQAIVVCYAYMSFCNMSSRRIDNI
jgi:multidrug resistance protein